MSKTKIQIKSKLFGSVLFEYEKENNTIKDTLEKAVEEGAYLEGADLEGADLEGADLEGAYLKGAYLEGADLKGAYLEGADLEGADLEGADLEGAYLEGAIIFYIDNDINNINEIVNDFIANTNISQLSVYENHNQIPTRYNSIWKNVLVINKWKLKEEKQEVKELTVNEVSKLLGYEIKIKGESK